MIDAQWLAGQLKACGLITDAQARAALSDGAEICLALLRNKAIEESELLRFLGLHFQTRYITTAKLSEATIPQWVLDLVPLTVCEELKVVPVRCDKQRTIISVVTPDPRDGRIAKVLQQAAGVQQVQSHVALPHAIEAAIKKWYKGDIHGFARIDQQMGQVEQMLETYDGRLIDLDDADEEEHLELAIDRSEKPATHPALEAILKEEDSDTHSRAAAAVVAAAAAGAATAALPAADSLLGLARALVELMEMDKGWRRGHSAEVAKLCATVGKKLGLRPNELAALELAACLHEIGKPTTPHLTLLSIDEPKARSLAEQAYQTPKKLLQAVTLPSGVIEILNAQYERLAGDGVPGRLAGAKVPKGARILAAVDAFLELSSNPERASERPETMTRLREVAATVFEQPQALDLLCSTLEEMFAEQQQRKRVLIIDPDLEAARSLEIDLAASGYAVTSLTTTAEAARAILSSTIDLIISEVAVKPVDGFDFLHRIRADRRTKSIPLIFVTAHFNDADVERAHELGAFDYLQKPCSPDELLARVRAALKN